MPARRPGVIALFLAASVANAVAAPPRSPGTELGPDGFLRRQLPEDRPPPRTPAYFGPTDIALAQITAGQYRRAIYTLAPLPDADPVAAVLRAQAHSSLGEHDRASAALDKPTLADLPAVQLQRARLLTDAGNLTAAAQLLSTPALSDNLQARLLLGQVRELQADYPAALTAYSIFTRYLADASLSTDLSGLDLVTVGRALDRHSALTSAYPNNPSLDQLILATFVRVYDVVDRDGPAAVEARIAAAEYFLSHDKPEDAAGELESVLKVNPRHPAAWKLLGDMALAVFDFDRADNAITKLRETDPNSPAADLLAARSFLVQRRANLAEPVLSSILNRQPDHLAALGLLAAVHALRLDTAAQNAALARADAIAPSSPLAYQELADQLAAMRQYPRAIAAYKTAIERAPWWTTPQNNLGLLYTQSGDEDLARSTLDAAHSLDPFNLRSTNYLRLLDRLAKLATVKSAHFEVRTDATTDPFLGPLLLEYMESVNADLMKLFDHQPEVSTYIEVFPTHAQFSVRTTGNPFIGTVGASTGRVIALVAPRTGAQTLGNFNWAQVLRHEYTHTITLSATENRIPHWMTEGLAVWAEQSPLRWEWVPMLYSAVTKNELFTMDRLNWGFVRPKRPTDRALAYAQSFWMCRFLIETHGRQSMLDLLAQFRAGKSQEQAFQTVLKQSPEDFHKAFLGFAKKETDAWGYDPISTATYNTLREQGESQIAAKAFVEAAKTWEEIARLRPVDPLPHQRLAGLYLTPALNDKAKARTHLEALNAVELKDNRYAKRLTKLSLDLSDLPAARRYAMSAIQTNPYDPAAHQLLLEVAEGLADQPLIDLQSQRLAQLAELDRRRQQDNEIPPNAPTAPASPR